ncbi:MAG: cytidine/deoxycytidylate deaminase family protein [Candidatus Pacebacteria bacterium]|nr:cytidine/deoxycytidylate deaminase family protein [Candidatus Paceibacterota bacterium]
MKKAVKKTIKDKRPSWDEYFMKIAEVVATRSNCISPAKGSVIVIDKKIISTGYNGTPTNVKNCIDGGCVRCINVYKGKIPSGTYNYDKNSKSECVCCHGEENAIVHAAKHGISTKGATLYTSFAPCSWCAKMIINAGIIRIVAKEDYPTGLSVDILEQAKVTLDRIKL